MSLPSRAFAHQELTASSTILSECDSVRPWRSTVIGSCLALHAIFTRRVSSSSPITRQYQVESVPSFSNDSFRSSLLPFPPLPLIVSSDLGPVARRTSFTNSTSLERSRSGPERVVTFLQILLRKRITIIRRVRFILSSGSGRKLSSSSGSRSRKYRSEFDGTCRRVSRVTSRTGRLKASGRIEWSDHFVVGEYFALLFLEVCDETFQIDRIAQISVRC